MPSTKQQKRTSTKQREIARSKKNAGKRPPGRPTGKKSEEDQVIRKRGFLVNNYEMIRVLCDHLGIEFTRIPRKIQVYPAIGKTWRVTWEEDAE